MAYTFSVNNNPLTGPLAMYGLISTLMSAGWLKKMDSDGTTYSSTGAQVTHGGAGTGGLGNTNAWVRLQAPAVNGGAVTNQTREITIQRGTTNALWRLKYSASALFTGGSPAATVTPSSTDEVFMLGGGTDASPTFVSWLATAGDERWHYAAGGAAEFYSFIAWSQVVGGTAARSAIFLDVMSSGSYPSNDVDPAVMYCNSFTAIAEIIGGFATTTVTNPSKARAWLGSTSAAGASLTSNNVGMGICTYGPTFISGALTIGTNPWTNKEELLPCLWGNTSGFYPSGIKGISTLFKMSTVVHTNGTVASYLSTRDRLCYGGLWLPWSGTGVLI